MPEARIVGRLRTGWGQFSDRWGDEEGTTSEGDPESERDNVPSTAPDVEKEAPIPEEFADIADRMQAAASRGEDVEVQLWRKAPTWASGYLGTITADPHDVAGLVEQVARDFGGESIQLRFTRRLPDGRKVWMRGAVMLRIARPPLVAGQPVDRLSGAVVDTSARRDDGREFVPVHTVQSERLPVRAGGGDTAIVAMLGTVLDRMDKRMERLESVVLERRAEPAQNPLSQVAETLGLLETLNRFQSGLQRTANPTATKDDDDEDDDEDLSWEATLSRLVNRKLEGEKGDEFLDDLLDGITGKKKESAEVAGWKVIPGGGQTTPATTSTPATTTATPATMSADDVGRWLSSMPPEQAADVIGGLQEKLSPAVLGELLKRAKEFRTAAKAAKG